MLVTIALTRLWLIINQWEMIINRVWIKWRWLYIGWWLCTWAAAVAISRHSGVRGKRDIEDTHWLSLAQILLVDLGSYSMKELWGDQSRQEMNKVFVQHENDIYLIGITIIISVCLRDHLCSVGESFILIVALDSARFGVRCTRIYRRKDKSIFLLNRVSPALL